MAQEKEDFSNKISSNDNSDSEDNALTNGSGSLKPDLGFENVHFSNYTTDGGASTSEQSAAPKSTTPTPRKEESPFSFKHFLKRDLSLPSAASSYEGTGAKPKVYTGASSQPRPAKPVLREVRESRDDSSLRPQANTSARDHCSESNEPYRRCNVSGETAGMPSLPDFVQDHLLMEQAYGGSRSPLSLHLEGLPDFTLGGGHGHEQTAAPCEYYDTLGGAGGRAADYRPSPLDLPSHLALDLTDSLSTPRRCHDPFPLDLPNVPNPSGAESLRLPDFLPQANTGGANGANGAAQDALTLERDSHNVTRRELRSAVQNASWLRREVAEMQAEAQQARREAAEARAGEQLARREAAGARAALLQLQQATEARCAGRPTTTSPDVNEPSTSRRPSCDDSSVESLQLKVYQQEEELRLARLELKELRGSQRSAARALNLATNTAESSLRDLLSGLEQVRGLASALDPP